MQHRYIPILSDEALTIIKSDHHWELTTKTGKVVNGGYCVARWIPNPNKPYSLMTEWFKDIESIIDYARKNPDEDVYLAVTTGRQPYANSKLKNLRIVVWEKEDVGNV